MSPVDASTDDPSSQIGSSQVGSSQVGSSQVGSSQVGSSQNGAQRGARQGAADEVDADPEVVARAICLRQLATSPRTRAQLADAMRARRVPPAVAERVLDRMTEVGLIDDAAYAGAWVESRHAGRGLARRALGAELRRRGVEPAVVDAAVSKLTDDDERAAARALVSRRLPLVASHPQEVQRRRLLGMLLRRGYPPGLARDAIEEALVGDLDGRGGAAGASVDYPDEPSYEEATTWPP